MGIGIEFRVCNDNQIGNCLWLRHFIVTNVVRRELCDRTKMEMLGFRMVNWKLPSRSPDRNLVEGLLD